MGTGETARETEFERCVTALLAGDTAFVFTFVERCGPIVAAMLAERGVPRSACGRLVEEVALALLDRGPDTPGAADAVLLVETVATDVASAPEAGAFVRASTCGAGGGHRSLHLIDIENLAGSPYVCDEWLATTLRTYIALAQVRDSDLVLMAANPRLWLRTAWLAPRDVAYQPAPGVDGADLNLLQRSPVNWVAQRFDRVVIGSGDGIFTELAKASHAAGLGVTVIAQPELLARDLRMTAETVRYMPPPRGQLTSRKEAA